MSPADILSAPLSDRLSLLELAREQNVSPPSTWRWGAKGVNGLKLPTAMLGHKRITTRSAFVWWVEQLTAMAAGEPRLKGGGELDRNVAAIETADCEADRLLGIAPRQKEEA